jgi:hypothetical protein
MMVQLEGRAQVISGKFNSQEVANSMWAFATKGEKPRERFRGSWSSGRRRYQGSSTRRLCKHDVGVCNNRGNAGGAMKGLLERRAEPISGEFNSQDVANALPAFATMLKTPGGRMMG